MYKNRNTGTGNGMRGTQGIGRNVIFRGISSNIPENVAKHSGECPQTFPGNVAKHSRECRQTFWGMSSNIPGNVPKHDNYDDFLIVGDLNFEIAESSTHDLCNSYNLRSLCYKSTYYKNPEKPSCIDLFLTSSPNSFQNTQTIETGLSDFHKLVVTILKMYLPNNQPKVITYRDYKNFDNSRFSKDFMSEMKKLGPLNNNISIFHSVCVEVLEKYAPEKRKYIRGNQANFMDSKLNLAIMLRSKLHNKFLKSRTN